MDQEEKPPPMGRNRSDSDDSHKIEFGARSSAQPKAKGDASGGSEQATANGLEEGESHPVLDKVFPLRCHCLSPNDLCVYKTK